MLVSLSGDSSEIYPLKGYMLPLHMLGTKGEKLIQTRELSEV